MKVAPYSILSMFKVGIGPSSSHTLAPMLIGKDFVKLLKEKVDLKDVTKIEVSLFGSLSLTGKGHLTDKAVVLGLSGFEPESITTLGIKTVIKDVETKKVLNINQEHKIAFDFEKDVIFNKTFLKEHENGMTIKAFYNNESFSQTYFSTGGGFFVTQEGFNKQETEQTKKLEYDFKSAKELTDLCKKHNCSIADIVLKRELQLYSEDFIKAYLIEIWDTMFCCVNNGLTSEDETLPGVLNLKRRAKKLHKRLKKQADSNIPNDTFSLEMLTCYALAASEENASGDRVVTAPTNGACGVIPAVLYYYNEFYNKLSVDDAVKFLLTAGAIGYLFRENASISGAEAGCQAEMGTASAMASAGFVSLIDNDCEKICTTAEIAIEHHLGMTCDPVAGLVQVPCIERNAFGAAKAVLASKMALNRETPALVSLDDGIKVMYQTGKDLNSDYRETSLGGLAKVINCNCTKCG